MSHCFTKIDSKVTLPVMVLNIWKSIYQLPYNPLEKVSLFKTKLWMSVFHIHPQKCLTNLGEQIKILAVQEVRANLGSFRAEIYKGFQNVMKEKYSA